MSKGTKQIRMGRIVKIVNIMEIILETLQQVQDQDEHIKGRITQLETDINTIKSEFDLT